MRLSSQEGARRHAAVREFLTYYYGLRALERIQAECGWDDRAFTELVFSCGKVSLGILRRLIALSAAERDDLLRRFSAVRE